MPTQNRRFHQVDVFTREALLGNPVAVVLDAEGLDEATMAAFARWTHLSETTFVTPPRPGSGADYHLRIFTPGGELPFAGHPTLGSCAAWLAAGGQPQAPDRVVQDCGAGLVTIRRTGGTGLAFAAPALRDWEPSATELAAVGSALGLPLDSVRAARHLDNGPHWLGLLIDTPERLMALRPDHAALQALGLKVGVAAMEPGSPVLAGRSNREARAFGATPAAPTAEAPADAPRLWVRAFAAPIGVPEDPVTGSLNASLAQWLMAEGRMPSHYTATQGQALGRDGQVDLQRDETGQVWVGGHTVACVTGQLSL